MLEDYSTYTREQQKRLYRHTGGPVMKNQPYILKPGEFFWEAPRDGFILPDKPKRRSAQEAAGGGVTNNYYLTAKYGHESELSLIERVKLLRMMG